ncbi:MAG: hypothetical protein ACFE9T_10950 [Promethearchaeota archaeon]
MEQVLVKKKVFEENLEELDEIIILGKLPAEKAYVELGKVKAEEKPIKKALSKILNKAKYNAKYHEELIPIKKVNRQVQYRSSYDMLLR